MTNVNVLLVDDQYLVREGIASLLALENKINIIGMAENGKEGIEKTLELKPDVILMDIRMPEMNGVEATIQIKSKLPDCKIIMLTTFDDDEFVVQSLLAGACGYFMKDISPENLAQAIRLAHSGIFQLSQGIAGKLVGSLQLQKSKTITSTGLTKRELEVLRLIAKGASNKEIAKVFDVSESTVKNHVSNILMRLELRDRTQAAIYAIQNGI